MTMVKFGLLATLEAKPGRGDELAAFLKQGRAFAAAEEGTVTWWRLGALGIARFALGQLVQPLRDQSADGDA
jgi:hypothetical protein